jgi:hypothetical protein
MGSPHRRQWHDHDDTLRRPSSNRARRYERRSGSVEEYRYSRERRLNTGTEPVGKLCRGSWLSGTSMGQEVQPAEIWPGARERALPFSAVCERLRTRLVDLRFPDRRPSWSAGTTPGYLQMHRLSGTDGMPRGAVGTNQARSTRLSSLRLSAKAGMLPPSW